MRSQYTLAAIARFRSHIVVTESCHLCDLKPKKDGYCHFKLSGFKGDEVYAHRMAYELAKGPIPEGMIILHLCSKNYPPGDFTYRRCANPDHLQLGTYTENSRQMVEEGRVAFGDRSAAHLYPDRFPGNLPGEQHPMARLTEEDVLGIRRKSTGRRGEQPQFAKEYAVTQQQISNVLRRKSWKHI